LAARDVVRATGPYAEAIAAVLSRGYIASSYEDAVRAARASGADVATLDGELVRGGHLVVGGAGGDARGILATKGEIKDLRARLDAGRAEVEQLSARVAEAAARLHATSLAIDDAGARLHAEEKAIVAFEGQLSRAREEAARRARQEEVAADARGRPGPARRWPRARVVRPRRRRGSTPRSGACSGRASAWKACRPGQPRPGRRMRRWSSARPRRAPRWDAWRSRPGRSRPASRRSAPNAPRRPPRATRSRRRPPRPSSGWTRPSPRSTDCARTCRPPRRRPPR